METYLDPLESNRWILVKSVDPEPFLDYLRAHHVLSDMDSETVQNPYVNQTRRARMGCFIDILRTKGPDGVNLFFTQLGWEYPHVFREIFRKEPEHPPSSYMQAGKSRISCNLDNLLKMGLDMSRLRSQQENLTGQMTDMELMLKHQRNEIEDLERENQRLRHFERDNQQIQDRLRTLTAKNEEIKEENRQFLHEIRILTLDVQKHRNNEADLQGKLDEVTQQIQQKSLELNRKTEEESDLRAKFEKVRQASLKIQAFTPSRPRPLPPRMKEEDFKRQVDSVMEEMQGLENTNKGLREQLKYMQDLLNDEKIERDQMHRRVCTLEHEKGNLETRLNTSVQKIERYYTKIKELEAQKTKLEEERIQMQQKVWETSQINERQFDQLHKIDARYDQLQQDYQKFRQEHRYCIPEEPVSRRPNMKARNDPALMQRRGLSPAYPDPEPGSSISTAVSAADGDAPARKEQEQALHLFPTVSTEVHPGSFRRNPLDQEPGQDLDNDDDDKCSTVTSCSSLSSSIFGQIELSCLEDHTEPKSVFTAHTEPVANFYIRSNIRELGDAAAGALAITEGDILYVQETGEEQWQAVKVNKATGQLCHGQRGYIPSMDRAHLDISSAYLRRSPSFDEKGALQRKNAVRGGKGLPHQSSLVATYTRVVPMKANRPLPVVLLGLSPTMISCVQETSLDWANILSGSKVQSAAQLFATPDDKHNLIVWEARPKDHNSDVYKYIIIIVILQSEESVSSLRDILGNQDLQVEFKQEAEKLKELGEFVQKAGLHSESLTITPGMGSSDLFWRAVKEKVARVQQQVFWLEARQKISA